MKRFSQLAQTASEADLVAGNFLAIDVPGAGGVTKKVPGNLVAKKSILDLVSNQSFSINDNPYDPRNAQNLTWWGTNDWVSQPNTHFAYTGKTVSYGLSSAASAVLDIRFGVADLTQYTQQFQIGLEGQLLRISAELYVEQNNGGTIDVYWQSGNNSHFIKTISEDGYHIVTADNIELTAAMLANTNRMLALFIVRKANGGRVHVGRIYIGSAGGSGLIGSNKIDNEIKQINSDILKLSSKVHTGKKYIVDQNGGGDFTKFTQALWNTRNEDAPIIIVKPGVYDVIDELGSTYFQNLTTDPGLMLNHGIHIIFESGAKVLANYTGNNSAVKSIWSPLNCAKGAALDKGFTIENMDIECSNVRYCVHDDCGGSENPHINVYKNCRMKLDQTNNDAWQSRQCIGGGVGEASTIIIDNCMFESIPTTSKPSAAVVSYHNSSSDKGSSKVYVSNSYVAGSSDNIVCRYYGTSQEMSLFKINNSSMPKSPAIEQEAGASVVNFEMVNYCNEIRNE